MIVTVFELFAHAPILFLLEPNHVGHCVLFDAVTNLRKLNESYIGTAVGVQYAALSTFFVVLANALIAYKTCTRQSLARRPSDQRRETEMTRALVLLSGVFLTNNIIIAAILVVMLQPQEGDGAVHEHVGSILESLIVIKHLHLQIND